jgi:hypothetical protein
MIIPLRSIPVVFLLLSASLSGCVIESPSNRPEANVNSASTLTPEESRDNPKHPDENRKLGAYISEELVKLGQEERNAIGRIDGDGRRLLALRAYLKAGADIRSRWSWSQEQIEKFKRSDEYKNALAEVEKVKAKFAEENPGYNLQVNIEVRSLEQQLKSWNETASVAAAGDELLAAANKELSKSNYRDSPSSTDLGRFDQFLRSYSTSITPTVAAPGLSPHGQLRAFDFQVMKGRQLVAGTSSATSKEDWDNAGWTERLKKAVGDASNRFDGPLLSPPEPWHYNYDLRGETSEGK